MKIIKILSFLVLVLVAQSLIGQTDWEQKDFSNLNYGVFDMIIESEDSLFGIYSGSRWNSDLTSLELLNGIGFSSDAGENWRSLLETSSGSSLISFAKRKAKIIIGGNVREPDSTAFFLISDLDFLSIDTINVKEIKEIKSFSKIETEHVYFVYEDQFKMFRIGKLDTGTHEVVLNFGTFSSQELIDQLFVFDSGIIFLRVFDMIFRSNDFGSFWSTLLSGKDLITMDFYDENNGVYNEIYQAPPPVDVLGSRTYITHDGGQNWEMVLSFQNGAYRYLKLITEHSIIGSGWGGGGSSSGPYADLFSDFQPFIFENLINDRLSPGLMEPVIKTDSCIYIVAHYSFYKTCEPSGLVNSNDLIKKPKIEIYPNPASNKITIKSPPDLSGNLKIYDSIGRFHFKQKLNSGETQISVDELNNGLYFLVHENFGTIGTFAVLK